MLKISTQTMEALGFKSLDEFYKERGINKTSEEFLQGIERDTKKYIAPTCKEFEKTRKKGEKTTVTRIC